MGNSFNDIKTKPQNFHPKKAVESGFLNCILINSRSLKNKLNELTLLLLSETYDILFFVETWLNDTVSDGILCTSTVYNVFRCDRLEKSGGGVAIFYKKALKINIIENIIVCQEVLICDLISTCKQKITYFVLQAS